MANTLLLYSQDSADRLLCQVYNSTHVHELDDWMADIRRLPVDIPIGDFGYMPAGMGVTHPMAIAG